MPDRNAFYRITTVLLLSCAFVGTGASQLRADVIPVFKLDGSLPESPPELMSLLGEAGPRTFGDWTARLRTAAEDPNVAAVGLLIEAPQVGQAQIQELTQSMKRLRDAGKDVHVFAESLNLGAYLLCTGASDITVVPAGSIMITGINPSAMYIRGLLDKIGVEPDLVHIGDYKTAGETFMRTGPSPAGLEQTEALIEDIYTQLIARVAEARRLSPDQAEKILTGGPYMAEEAREHGLIDEVRTRKEFLTWLQRRHAGELVTDYGEEKPFDLDFSSPFAIFQLFTDMMADSKVSGADTIAVVHVEGLIVQGRSSESGLLGRTAGSTTLRKALNEVADDKSVRACVLRVDSTGGSALASEIIWQATQRAGEAKPFVVSMGNVAASGGYYVACAADKIYADPGTITGSIGVIGGKFVTSGLWEKIGVSWHETPRGVNATLDSPARAYSPEQRKVIERYMNLAYGVFKDRIRVGRGDRIKGDLDALAGGRVYTGKQALEIGLVDEMGGLEDALAHAAKLAGLSKYETRILPGPKTLMELLEEMMGMDDEADLRSDVGLRSPTNAILNAALPLLAGMEPTRVRAVVRCLQIAELMNREALSLTMSTELVFP